MVGKVLPTIPKTGIKVETAISDGQPTAPPRRRSDASVCVWDRCAGLSGDFFVSSSRRPSASVESHFAQQLDRLRPSICDGYHSFYEQNPNNLLAT